MQGIIMAAGKGSRIKEITHDDPKSFLQVNGVKLIEYNIALLNECGINDIIVVTGYQTEKMEELLNRYSGVKVVFNPFFEETNVLGSFYLGQEYLIEDTVYLHADTLCEPKMFKKMLEFEGDMILPVDFDSCNEEAMKVTTKNGEIVTISKEIPLNVAEGEFIGILKMSKEILPHIKKATKSLMQEKCFSSYFEGAIQRVIDQNTHKILAMDTECGFWGEIDFYEDYKKVCDDMPAYFVDMAKTFIGER